LWDIGARLSAIKPDDYPLAPGVHPAGEAVRLYYRRWRGVTKTGID
jgi:hypothetical protein